MSLAVRFNTIAELFDNVTSKYAAQSRPVLMGKVGGTYVGISFAELRAAVEELSCGFHALGMKRGDKVAIIAENRPEWVMCDMALLRLGVVTVPLYTTLTPRQVGFILADAGVQYVIVSNQFQLKKAQKAIEEAPSFRTIIAMSEKGMTEGAGAQGVKLLADVRADGASRIDLKESIRALAREVAPDDLLTIIYTSGTTGNPKGVMLSHRNLVTNVCSSASCLPISEQDVLLSYLPLSHTFERVVYYTAFACGATIAYAESVDTVRENLLEVRPTIVTTVPRLFERLHNRLMKQVEGSPAVRQKIFHWAMGTGYAFADARRRGAVSPVLAAKNGVADRLVFRKIKDRTGGRLRFFVSGGAALAADLGKFFEAIGIPIIEGYGMTEASPVISVNRIDDYKFGTVGKAVPGVEVKIAPDGEILARGENIMQGYWKNPADTAEMIDKSGWLHTGDIGVFDHDGFLVITDRKKHIFVNSGGKNIAPQHVEGVISQSPYVDQLILIGEKRMFCSALIVPEFETVRDYIRGLGHGTLPNEQLAGHPEVVALFDREINALQKDLANYERIRKFRLLPKPLTIESGELTPTLKVKRKVVEEKYRDLIEQMYDGIA